MAVLEARSGLGGRILTVHEDAHRGAFELGPAWFWDDHRQVQALMTELGIKPFVQFETGAALYDTGPNSSRSASCPTGSHHPIALQVVCSG